MCATRDITTVAAAPARSLLERVEVLCPEDLSLDDMARIMSELLGKTVRCKQIPSSAFKARVTGFGTSEAMAQATSTCARP